MTFLYLFIISTLLFKAADSGKGGGGGASAAGGGSKKPTLVQTVSKVDASKHPSLAALASDDFASAAQDDGDPITASTSFGQEQIRLITHLLQSGRHDSRALPSSVEGIPVNVRLGMNLYQIVDVVSGCSGVCSTRLRR